MRISMAWLREHVRLMLKKGVRDMEILHPVIELLSSHGCDRSSIMLGEFYRTGNLLDLDGCKCLNRNQLIHARRYRAPNIEKAEFYLERARRQGNAVALYYLMALYIDRLEYEKACSCGQRALPHLTKEMRGCCYHALGYLYYNFNTMENAKKIAVSYWRKAARCGNGTASYELGVLYLYGEQVRRNKKLAQRWFEKCISLNNFTVSDAKRRLKKLLLA